MTLKAFLGPMFAVGMFCGTMPLRVTSLHPIQLRVSRASFAYSIVLVMLTFVNMGFTTFKIVNEGNMNEAVPPAGSHAREQARIQSIPLRSGHTPLGCPPHSIPCGLYRLRQLFGALQGSLGYALYRRAFSIFGIIIRAQEKALMNDEQLINAQTLIIMSLGSHWVSVCRLVPKLPILIDYIVSIDRKLPLLDCDLRLDHSYFSLGLKFCVLLAVTVPVFLFYISLHSGDRHVFWFGSLVFHNLVSYTCELQLLLFFLFFKCRFRIINEVLSLRNRENDHRMKTLRMRKIQLPSFEERNLLKHIEVIHECYLKLCDSWVILNDIYSVQNFTLLESRLELLNSAQVLFSTSGCFLKAIFNVYTLMTADSTINHDKTLNSLIWLVFFFYRFSFLAAVATLTAEEANKTKAIIAYMSCFYFEKCIKEELDVFWVNACCRDLEFSTCGLFRLNSSLITKACVTGITYLVLLVQFNPQIGLA